MSSAKLENGSQTLENFRSAVVNTKYEMESDYNALISAFNRARQEWRDKNADVTAEYLAHHSRSLNVALSELDEMYRTLGRLINFIKDYE